MMFINRDYSRTEHDDFVLNVEPQLRDQKEAVPVLVQVLQDPPSFDTVECVGWNVLPQYE